MGLSRAVEWWNEWQLLVLVLSSLGIQYFLAFFAGARRFYIPSWFRFLIWLSFLGGDAVAIYGLATLFNRQKKLSAAYDSRDLELFWAPILLIHLGGQLSITAYNLEDNEMWKRYIITAPSQVAVAFYSFYKSWPSSVDKRLSAAAVLLFIYGIMKCFLKPWALKSASFNSLASSFKTHERSTATSREEELEKYVQQVRSFVQQAGNNPPPVLNHQGFSKPDRLIVDYELPYSDRLLDIQSLWALDQKEAYESLKGDLSNTFYLLYTRLREDKGFFFRMGYTSALSFIVGIALFLFHKSPKKSYSPDDVTVTFVLLWGTFLLELTSSLLAGPLKKLTSLVFDYVVVQGSILADVPWDKKSIAHHSYSSEDITKLVLDHVHDGWENYITDAESYRKFSDFRGQLTLHRQGCGHLLGWSLQRPFIESVLIWHLATDLCFHKIPRSTEHECARRCTEISNYMMHLMRIKPEMLFFGGTSVLSQATFMRLLQIFWEEERPRNTKDLVRKLFSLYGSKRELFRETDDVYKAMRLAQRLVSIDEKRRWEVIRGVWVEMLCFSASRCRGFMHAKELGSGGEYLSTVWLLLARAGMETFSERLHRTRKPRSSDEKSNEHYQEGIGEGDAEVLNNEEKAASSLSSSKGGNKIRELHDDEISVSQ